MAQLPLELAINMEFKLININYLGCIDLGFLAGKKYLRILNEILNHEQEHKAILVQIPRCSKKGSGSVCPEFLDSVLGFDPIEAARETVRHQGHAPHHSSFYHLAMLYGVANTAVKAILENDL